MSEFPTVSPFGLQDHFRRVATQQLQFPGTGQREPSEDKPEPIQKEAAGDLGLIQTFIQEADQHMATGSVIRARQSLRYAMDEIDRLLY